MTKNSFINAALALAYIIVVASIMFYGLDRPTSDNTIFIPITVISLFTLSATIMGYLFLNQPFQLYIDGKKKEAVALFLQTVAVFAGLTALILLVAFLKTV